MIKDSVKKPLEMASRLYNVRKQELFSVFHKCFEQVSALSKGNIIVFVFCQRM